MDEKNHKSKIAMNIEYTCPMHPEIIRDHPGNCPLCGMTAVPLVSYLF